MSRVEIIDVVKPLPAFDALKGTARRRVSHREGDRRRLHLVLILGYQAHPAGLDVRTDANATQDPVNHSFHGHGRPPTIKKRNWTGRRPLTLPSPPLRGRG